MQVSALFVEAVIYVSQVFFPVIFYVSDFSFQPGNILFGGVFVGLADIEGIIGQGYFASLTHHVATPANSASPHKGAYYLANRSGIYRARFRQ